MSFERDPPSDMAQLLAMIYDLCQQNDTLQDNVQVLQMKSQEDVDPGLELLEPQSFSQVIWDDQVPENFKPPTFATYDGKSDPHEHIITLNNIMEIIEANDSLKCKFMVDIFKESTLRWYMNLPRYSIVCYQDFTKKMVQQFSTGRHQKVSTTTLFNVCQLPSESLRDYMARFNEETIKVSHFNLDIFVEYFQHGL